MMKSELAKARDKWLQSDEGEKCCQGSAAGQYLENRLRLALIAGWDACENACKPAVNGTEPTELAKELRAMVADNHCNYNITTPILAKALEVCAELDHQAGELKRLKEELWATAEWLEKQDSIAASKIADSIKQTLPPNSAGKERE